MDASITTRWSWFAKSFGLFYLIGAVGRRRCLCLLAVEQEAVRPMLRESILRRRGRAMAVEERDPHTGYLTTGHEWNGIKELNTPVPRLVYFFLIVTALFSRRSTGC